MSILPGFAIDAGGHRDRRHKRSTGLALMLILVVLVGSRCVSGQAVESADAGRALLSVGAAASGVTLQYGDRKILGLAAWVDADPIRHFGFEGEMRRLEYHQVANVHAETYLGGLRYHFNYGRMQPYIKALGGDGHFNFPYNYA